jgi:capsular polysaccharide transport system permease protein
LDTLPASEQPKRSSTSIQQLLGRGTRNNRLFVATVVLPTVLAAIYYGLIASDIYISESRFVVRSPQRQAQTGLLNTFLQGTGFSRAQDDAYSVNDFILSRDALKKLNDRLALAKAFGNSSVDFLNRFAALDWDDSFEALHRYYLKRVSVDYDTASSISVLRVNAFTAEDSYKINELLLGMSEHLVNQLSDRGRQDIIRFSAAEAKEAERQAKDAAVALAVFRNQNAILNPEQQSVIQLQLISKLQDELIATKTQLAQLRAFTPDNPQIPVLRNRLDNLQKEMDAELAKVAGGSSGSLANKAAAYERLALDREFADKQLAAALASLEAARNEAQRQQLYLERVAQPNLPDYPVEPRRIRSVLMVFVLGLLAWGILSLLLASVREHFD